MKTNSIFVHVIHFEMILGSNRIRLLTKLTIKIVTCYNTQYSDTDICDFIQLYTQSILFIGGIII